MIWKQLVDPLKFGARRISPKQIARIAKKRGCNRGVRRITPQVLSSWAARLSGEVVAVDTIYPLADIGADGIFSCWRATDKIPALLVADSLTSPLSRQVLKTLDSERMTRISMNDRV